MKGIKLSKEILAIGVWLMTTLSLATWWVIFNFRQVEELKSYHLSDLESYIRKQHMLVYEGLFLFGLLLIGGIGLYSLLFRERRLNETIRQFFAAFTHEMKTSLASLKLQAESLQEEVSEDTEAHLLARKLVKDALRIELQLENSLFLAQMDKGKFYTESLSLQKILQNMQYSFPDLTIHLAEDRMILCDRRVLECVLKNLLQNAVVHGKARTVNIAVRDHNDHKVTVVLHDDGSGFKGDLHKMGEIFYRHRSNSGSGIGLFIVRTLMDRVGGKARFGDQSDTGAPGFLVELQFVSASTQKGRS